VTPPFIRVVPEEIGRHGFAGATVVGLIRYRCSTDGPGRFVVDGVRWWRASFAEIAAELHVSRDVVKRTMKRLGDAVAASNFEFDGGRTLAYHAPPYDDAVTSERAEAPRSDQRKGGIAPRVGRNRPEGGAESPFAPLYGEGEEGGEGAGGHGPTATPPPDEQSANGNAPIADRDPEPPRWCPLHPGGTDAPCRPCGIQRRAHTAWEGRQRERARANAQTRRDLIADCPDCDDNGHIDLGDAVAKCQHPNLTASTGAR